MLPILPPVVHPQPSPAGAGSMHRMGQVIRAPYEAPCERRSLFYTNVINAVEFKAELENFAERVYYTIDTRHRHDSRCISLAQQASAHMSPQRPLWLPLHKSLHSYTVTTLFHYFISLLYFSDSITVHSRTKR